MISSFGPFFKYLNGGGRREVIDRKNIQALGGNGKSPPHGEKQCVFIPRISQEMERQAECSFSFLFIFYFTCHVLFCLYEGIFITVGRENIIYFTAIVPN